MPLSCDKYQVVDPLHLDNWKNCAGSLFALDWRGGFVVYSAMFRGKSPSMFHYVRGVKILFQRLMG